MGITLCGSFVTATSSWAASGAALDGSAFRWLDCSHEETVDASCRRVRPGLVVGITRVVVINVLPDHLASGLLDLFVFRMPFSRIVGIHHWWSPLVVTRLTAEYTVVFESNVGCALLVVLVRFVTLFACEQVDETHDQKVLVEY